MDDMTRLRVINKSIWLRDNSQDIGNDKLLNAIEDLHQYGLFSSRQLSLLVNKRISHQKITSYLDKRVRTGGKLDPNTLEDIKECFEARRSKSVDFRIVKRILNRGTSQNMIAVLTGINQSTISKRTK